MPDLKCFRTDSEVESVPQLIKESSEVSAPQPVLQANVFEEGAEVFGGHEASIDKFLYGAQRAPFLGRKEDLRELENFLASPKAFCWWLVTGQGGLGKSRLALGLCLRNGNLWRAGFLPSDSNLDRNAPVSMGYENWIPNQPTLIIIDYAALRAAEIGKIIRTMKMRADRNELPFPVRMLLLEREAINSTKGNPITLALLKRGGFRF